MEPKNLKFGGGTAESFLNPFVLFLVLIVGVMILCSSRKKILIPFLAVSILVPIDQVLVLGGLHFPMLRVLSLFGIARLIRERVAGRKILVGGFSKLDWVITLLMVVTAINAVALFREAGALVYQIGNLYTFFGVYFLLRFLVRDEQDILKMIRTIACIAVPIAAVMIYEQATGHNPYALLGGANASFYANIMSRGERFRATGCFGQPILAGTFGAILIPLFALLWQSGRKHRVLAAVGVLAATVITLTSNSSTPVLAYAAGVAGLWLWPIRNWMRVVRWGIVLLLVTLHMVMNAPVWHLISRIDISGGSSSDHRYMLVELCIRHFSDWWLMGVKSTASWGWDMWDVANQYVSICDNSGFLPFLLFIAVLVYGFKFVGKARRATRESSGQMFLWALGAALFSNCVAFFGISYWDQTTVVWYGLLSAIIAASVTIPKKVKAITSIPQTRNGGPGEDRSVVQEEAPTGQDIGTYSPQAWLA